MKGIIFLPKTVALCSLVAVLNFGLWATTTEAKVQSEYHRSAEKYFAKGKLDKAAHSLKMALLEDPLDTKAHYMLGSVLASEGKEDQAIIGFQRTLKLDPTHPKALHNLGTLLLKRGQAVPAAELLESAIDQDPEYLPPYNSLAKAYYEAGLPELAIATYEEVLSRDGTNKIAKENLKILVAANKKEKDRSSKASDTSSETSEDAPSDNYETKAPLLGIIGVPHVLGADEEDDEKTLPFTKKSASLLRELLLGLPNVRVEERGDLTTLVGWTEDPRARKRLDKILAGWPKVLDLTEANIGDSQRMVEIDAVLFVIKGQEAQSVGFNFLRLIDFSYTFAASSGFATKTTGLAAPGTIQNVLELPQTASLLIASVDYDVNIANAAQDRVAVLARPHLTTLNGTPATFLAGGEFVFRVSGIESGDIKPYPFGTSLNITPTVLRTPGENGRPRIHLAVKADRTSVLEFLTAESGEDSLAFDKLSVSSQAVLDLGETLILSGLNQRESRITRSGVPILKEIPLLKYIFSQKTTIETNTAIIILLTPRDPAFMNQKNRDRLAHFVRKRRAFIKATQGTVEDMRKFEKKYPNWRKLPPNRFSSHFFMAENSELYRRVSAEDIIDEDLDLDLLGDVIEGEDETQEKNEETEADEQDKDNDR